MSDTIIVVRALILRNCVYRQSDEVVKAVTSFGKNADECISMNCNVTTHSGSCWIVKDSFIDLVFRETPGSFFGMILRNQNGNPYLMDAGNLSCVMLVEKTCESA